MVIVSGNVVSRFIGCAEGSGQDYVRIEGVVGVVEAHLAFGTSSAFVKGDHWTITTDTAALTGSFTVTFLTLAIVKSSAGVVWDDIIFTSGANTIALHAPKGTAALWLVGLTLNVGFLKG